MLEEKSSAAASPAGDWEVGTEGVTGRGPASLGARGVEKWVPVSLDETELPRLRYSADMLRGIYEGL